MRKAIIVSNNLGRLANQLWQYISVYSYSLENKLECENLAFFEYHQDFPNLRKVKIQLLLGTIHSLFIPLFGRYARYISYFLLTFWNRALVTLQPDKNVYFSNWLYRNPRALTKYRKDVIWAFMPTKSIWDKITKKTRLLRRSYKMIIGVHIRQGDYKTLLWNHLYFEDKLVYKILKQYLLRNKLNKEQVCFLLCSDGKVNINLYKDINVYLSTGTPIEDLFTLSLTDLIIGSDSTFGAFAAYYGDIPHIIFKKRVDWDYYLRKTNYFENKYNTTVHY